MLPLEDKSKIQFHFFDREDLFAIRERLERISIDSETLSMQEIPHGIVPLPFLKDGKHVSGVFGANGKLVPESSQHAGGMKLTPEPDRSVFDQAYPDPRTAVYFGYAAPHYGHCLLESLSRAWAWWHIHDEFVPVVVSTQPLAPLASVFFKMLPGFTERLQLLQRPTKFRTIMLPEKAFVLQKRANREFKSFCMRLVEQVLPAQTKLTDQPVYLSRRGIARRRLVGEERLEQLLEKEGFLIVRPETLSIPEQITLFNRHSWIIAPMGSACHTRLFSQSPTNLVMLTRNDFTANFMLCDSLSAGTAHYANVLVIPEQVISLPPPRQPVLHKEEQMRLLILSNRAPVLLQEDKLLVLLKQLGLVRPNAAFEGPAPDVESYMANWLTVGGNATRIRQLTARLRASPGQSARLRGAPPVRRGSEG